MDLGNDEAASCLNFLLRYDQYRHERHANITLKPFLPFGRYGLSHPRNGENMDFGNDVAPYCQNFFLTYAQSARSATLISQ